MYRQQKVSVSEPAKFEAFDLQALRLPDQNKHDSHPEAEPLWPVLCQQHQRSGWFLGFWCKLLKGSVSRDTVHPHGAFHQHLISRTTPAHYDMYDLAD
jgi:hypothetical protein